MCAIERSGRTGDEGGPGGVRPLTQFRMSFLDTREPPLYIPASRRLDTSVANFLMRIERRPHDLVLLLVVALVTTLSCASSGSHRSQRLPSSPAETIRTAPDAELPAGQVTHTDETTRERRRPKLLDDNA